VSEEKSIGPPADMVTYLRLATKHLKCRMIDALIPQGFPESVLLVDWVMFTPGIRDTRLLVHGTRPEHNIRYNRGSNDGLRCHEPGREPRTSPFCVNTLCDPTTSPVRRQRTESEKCHCSQSSLPQVRDAHDHFTYQPDNTPTSVSSLLSP